MNRKYFGGYHVYDEINVLFPDVTSMVCTISVSDEEITVSDNTVCAKYNIDLLEKYLIDLVEC